MVIKVTRCESKDNVITDSKDVTVGRTVEILRFPIPKSSQSWLRDHPPPSQDLAGGHKVGQRWAVRGRRKGCLTRKSLTFTGKLLCSAGDLLWKLYGVNAGPADGAASSATELQSSPPGLVDSEKEGAANMRVASSPAVRTERSDPGSSPGHAQPVWRAQT